MDYKPWLSGPEEDVIRIAIIGTSGIAPVYAKRLKKMKKKGVVVESVYSRTLERAREFAGRHGIPRFTNDLEVILDDERLRAVVITTEPERHVELALQVLQAEKHMLIEKPLDVSLKKAAEFVSQAGGFQGIISVVSQKRFDPVLCQMQARLVQEASGSPKTVQLSMMWSRDYEYYQKGTGWRQKESPVFLNQGIHWLDVLNWFFGNPGRIQATSRSTRSFLSCADQTTAVIDYQDNTSVSLCGGTFCERSYPDRFTIYYPQGYLDYEELVRACGETKTGWHNHLLHRFFKQRAKPSQHAPDLFSRQVKDFIDAIRQRRPPVTTLENALQALKVACLISEL